MKKLRSGYTTGACAAAGLKACFLARKGQHFSSVTLEALDGVVLDIPIKQLQKISRAGEVETWKAEVVKYSGDDPDITNGISIITVVRFLTKGRGIFFSGGEGVGTVTKPGLAIPVGEPAINPGPRQLMRQVARMFSNDWQALEITISAPEGNRLARQTLNPALGIKGGISIIGTTGLLKPMSEEAFKKSLAVQLDVALAAGFHSVIFVPGRMGQRQAEAVGLPHDAVIQTSNFIGYMLDTAQEKGITQIILFGHIGKLVKVAAGNFYTHNLISDARRETMAAYAAEAGMSTAGICDILSANTAEDACHILDQQGFYQVYDRIAQRASQRSKEREKGKLSVGTVLLSLSGRVLGFDASAERIGREFSWHLASPINYSLLV